MMNVVMVLALTTRVEDLLGTLERLHLPFVVFLPAVVMLRFIPTFTNDIRQVWETLRIRGWPMGRDDYDAPNPVGSPAVHADPLSRTQIL